MRASHRGLLLAFSLAGLGLTASPHAAWADSCGKSREYLLSGMAGDLLEPPQAYQDLFKVCLGTVELANVKDAFILMDGGIGVISKGDGIATTAATLSQFCQRFPRATLRFISRSDQTRAKTMGQLLTLSSTGVTPCRKILGNSDAN